MDAAVLALLHEVGVEENLMLGMSIAGYVDLIGRFLGFLVFVFLIFLGLIEACCVILVIAAFLQSIILVLFFVLWRNEPVLHKWHEATEEDCRGDHQGKSSRSDQATSSIVCDQIAV